MVGHVGLGPVIRHSFKMALNYCQTYRGVASETAFDISLFTNERDAIVLDYPLSISGLIERCMTCTRMVVFHFVTRSN